MVNIKTSLEIQILKTSLKIQILVCDNEMLHISSNAGSFIGFLLQFDFGICNDTKISTAHSWYKKTKEEPEQSKVHTAEIFFNLFPPNVWIDCEFMNWLAYS